MKTRRTLTLLIAGILTASALSIGASAADAGTDMAPEAGIAQEETIREKKTKKSADSTAEDSTAKEKKTASRR